VFVELDAGCDAVVDQVDTKDFIRGDVATETTSFKVLSGFDDAFNAFNALKGRIDFCGNNAGSWVSFL
jgi:NAD(P)-dependent dehydrogenase (short-subunit alcohol dehydrogenase family)